MAYVRQEEVYRGDIPPGLTPYVSPVQPTSGLGFLPLILAAPGAAGAASAAGSGLLATAGGIASAIASITKIFSGIGGGGGDHGIKLIYQQIPQSMIRVTGGRGTWTDTLTGEKMNDLGTEVRKMAMMASALGVFVNRDNWLFDDTTGRHVTPDAVLGRWNTLFGQGASFQSAYSSHPELFRVYGPSSSNDPIIVTVGKIEQAPPLPPEQRTSGQFAHDTIVTGGSTAGLPGIMPPGPRPSVPPTSGPPLTAGISSSTLIGGVVILGILGAALYRGRRR